MLHVTACGYSFYSLDASAVQHRIASITKNKILIPQQLGLAVVGESSLCKYRFYFNIAVGSYTLDHLTTNFEQESWKTGY